jgi:hypothetical protein
MNPISGVRAVPVDKIPKHGTCLTDAACRPGYYCKKPNGLGPDKREYFDIYGNCAPR